MRLNSQSKANIIGSVLSGTGAACYATGMLEPHLAPMIRMGSVLVILGGQTVLCGYVAAIVRQVHGPSRVMFDKGFEMGERSGFRKGRRAARPVVVHIPAIDTEEGASAPFFSR